MGIVIAWIIPSIVLLSLAALGTVYGVWYVVLMNGRFGGLVIPFFVNL
jgi:hypothetical protein